MRNHPERFWPKSRTVLLGGVAMMSTGLISGLRARWRLGRDQLGLWRCDDADRLPRTIPHLVVESRVKHLAVVDLGADDRTVAPEPGLVWGGDHLAIQFHLSHDRDVGAVDQFFGSAVSRDRTVKRQAVLSQKALAGPLPIKRQPVFPEDTELLFLSGHLTIPGSRIQTRSVKITQPLRHRMYDRKHRSHVGFIMSCKYQTSVL
jgi:hypothetical protein